MRCFRLRWLLAATTAAGALALGGCQPISFGSFDFGMQTAPPEPAPAPELPASIRSEEIVGRWGFVAYHDPSQRSRMEAKAKGLCGKPYVIGAGPNGGVMMHLADQPQPQELRLKGGPGGKNYVGPPGQAGGPQDREVVSFDGKVLVMRYVDNEVDGRYGTSIYVRCSPKA
jgi:hypothetical protein